MMVDHRRVTELRPTTASGTETSPGPAVDAALQRFTDAQLELLEAGRELLAARERLDETDQTRGPSGPAVRDFGHY